MCVVVLNLIKFHRDLKVLKIFQFFKNDFDLSLNNSEILLNTSENNFWIVNFTINLIVPENYLHGKYGISMKKTVNRRR